MEIVKAVVNLNMVMKYMIKNWGHSKGWNKWRKSKAGW
jgi:hypothetical protein